MPETGLPEIGKISPEVFNELIFPRLGAVDKKVLVGPQHGVDVGIVEIGGQAVALTTDPIFIVPEYGWERAAWFAIHILISDVVTSGLPPRYAVMDLNLPMAMTREQLQTVWSVIHEECKKAGIAIVGGHTARYENCHYPMVGGGTIIAIGGLDEYVNPKFVREGDKIIITKGPAIEACGIFAAMFPHLLEQKYGAAFSKKAQDIFYKMSAVEEARAAVSVGVRDNGVTSMHDATECGIWGALYEIAHASNLGLTVDRNAIVIEEGVPEICDFFKIDPYSSISEGTLVATCRAGKADAILKAIAAKGIRASVVGEITSRAKGIKVIESGKERKLEHPRVDPFWKAFYDAAASCPAPK